MLRLSNTTITKPHDAPGHSQGSAAPGPTPVFSRNPRAAEFIAWLASEDLRLPDEVDSPVEGTEPDLIYRLADGNAAVFVLTSDNMFGETKGRDDHARDDLRDLGWSVITIRPDADWSQVARRYPSVFGSRQ